MWNFIQIKGRFAVKIRTISKTVKKSFIPCRKKKSQAILQTLQWSFVFEHANTLEQIFEQHTSTTGSPIQQYTARARDKVIIITCILLLAFL